MQESQPLLAGLRSAQVAAHSPKNAIYWKPGWFETPKDEWTQIVENLLAGERWVMDGNYGGTLEQRLASCDTVVFLDLPRSVCLWRAAVRRVRFRRKSRPDMREGCPERLTWDFVRWIWEYPLERRPKILQRLSALDARRQVVVFGQQPKSRDSSKAYRVAALTNREMRSYPSDDAA